MAPINDICMIGRVVGSRTKNVDTAKTGFEGKGISPRIMKLFVNHGLTERFNVQKAFLMLVKSKHVA